MIDNIVLIVTGTLHERDVQASGGVWRHDPGTLQNGWRCRGPLLAAGGRSRGAALHCVVPPPDAHSLWGLACCIAPIMLYTQAHKPALALSRTQELLDKCNPLGVFDAIATLAVAQNMRDLYRLVLVDTPLAPYFSGALDEGVGYLAGSCGVHARRLTQKVSSKTLMAPSALDASIPTGYV